LHIKKVRRRKKAVGAGYRGGNWNNDSSNARVSDRNNAANTNANRNNNNGIRCVKTSPDSGKIIKRRKVPKRPKKR